MIEFLQIIAKIHDKCIIKHGKNSLTSQTIKKKSSVREVRFPGPPVFDKGHEEKDVAVGDSVILSCKVDEKGSGNVDVSWVYNGNPVENGQLSDSIEVSQSLLRLDLPI